MVGQKDVLRKYTLISRLTNYELDSMITTRCRNEVKAVCEYFWPNHPPVPRCWVFNANSFSLALHEIAYCSFAEYTQMN